MNKLGAICVITLLFASCSSNEENTIVEAITIESEKKQSCLSVIEEILTTSDRFKEEVGDLKYITILERSPFPKRDQAMGKGEFYDFNISENLKDHISNIARFSFDPERKKLFIYDVMEDELVEIPFDRKLLNSLNEACI